MEANFKDVVNKLFHSIFDALNDCVNLSGILTKNKINDDWIYQDSSIKSINSHFKWLVTKGYYSYNSTPDRHIIAGINDKENPNRYSRAAQLTINAFVESQEETKRKGFNGFIIPSPLYILYNLLTVPNQLQSSAYSLVICRNILLTEIYEHTKGDVKASLRFESIRDAIETFRKYYIKRDNTPASKNPAVILTGHFLAMKGMMFLRFDNSGASKKNGFEKESSISKELFKNFFETKRLIKTDQKGKIIYEFRLSLNYTDLPDTSEVINQISGMPLPIRGAETIFFGGIQKSSDKSLVVSISGGPGIGKTTLALAIGGLISPFGTDCLYLATEEKPKDLLIKLENVIPSYLKKQSFYRNTLDWFNPIPLELDENTSFENFIEFLKHLKKKISPVNMDEGIFPSMLVIDNISRLINTKNNAANQELFYEHLEEFIQECKEQEAIVILISSEEALNDTPLEYLVDVSIRLVHKNTSNILVKPSREFHLLKTRHQLSRPGAHQFHISGVKGVRISPQIPSQMDRKEKMRKHLPDYNNILHTLNFITKPGKLKDKEKIYFKRYLNIYSNSNILIHGHGSSGKAGLALKILLSPPCSKDVTYPQKDMVEVNEIFFENHFIDDFSSQKFKRKILVVSFLYSSEYYDYLVDLLQTLNKQFYTDLIEPEVEYIHFYPGYLTPEDMVHKISRYIEEAIFLGRPYTGILLDGLHNVFLQFPNVQDRSMIWPMLYSLLGRYNLTVISTFTNFSINNSQQSTDIFSSEDTLLRRQGQEPFLHALVQSADFYIFVEPKNDDKSIAKSISTRTYSLVVSGAINQPVPLNHLIWNRENLKITGIDDGKTL